MLHSGWQALLVAMATGSCIHWPVLLGGGSMQVAQETENGGWRAWKQEKDEQEICGHAGEYTEKRA